MQPFSQDQNLKLCNNLMQFKIQQTHMLKRTWIPLKDQKKEELPLLFEMEKKVNWQL